jgi:hypothetical protein
MIKKRRKAQPKKHQIECAPCKISLMATIMFTVLAGILVYLSLETLRIKDRKTMQSLRYSQAQYLEQLDALQAKVKIYENAPPARQVYISDPVTTPNGEVYIAQDNHVDIYIQDGENTKLLQRDIPANTNGTIPPVLRATNSPNIVELITISKDDQSKNAFYYIKTETLEVLSIEIIKNYYLDIETSLKKIRIQPLVDCSLDDECSFKGFQIGDKEITDVIDIESNILLRSGIDVTKTNPAYSVEYLGFDINLENIFFNIKITNESPSGNQIIEDINLRYNLKTGSLLQAEPDFLLKSTSQTSDI